ncbi:MAG TPA: hypothetical protein VH413_15825 [Verrucomicrobiae bacterium]|jgi:hypothetical protein|nr:hypothetical protein [Verrucomicrobiae bacterium]
MPTPETNDPLDAFLREHEGYIEDAGFTARVVESLPRKRRLSPRTIILLSAIATGFILAGLWMLPLREIITVDRQGALLLLFTTQSLMLLAVALLIGASLLWSLYATLKWED